MLFTKGYVMSAYRKERIYNAIGFFVQEHYLKTKQPITQMKLWKYLAFFEAEVVKKTGVPPLELKYQAWEWGPVPVELRENIKSSQFHSELVEYTVKNEGVSTQITFYPAKGNEYDLDYFSENEIEEMFRLIEIFADRFVKASDMSESSHQEIMSWRRAWKNRGNAKSVPMDFRDEFPGNVLSKKEPSLQEENFLAYAHLKHG